MLAALRRTFRWELPLLPIVTLLPLHEAVAAGDVTGRWLTEDRGGVIEIAPCGAALCGRIVGMSEPLAADGSVQVDNQGRPKCGLAILNAPDQTQPGRWAGGITNPDDGKLYDVHLSVDERDRLHLRGYILTPLLGATQIWTRYAGAIGAGCRME